MVVCFCINNLGSFGLGATLTSLIKNCSNTNKLELIFCCASVDRKIKKSIQQLLLEVNFLGQSKFIDFKPEITFKKYRSLQGDYTPYGRLLIPDIVNSNQVIYLDSDLIIETDILDLNTINLEQKIIGAVSGSELQYNLERNFYLQQLCLNPKTLSFNSGVLVINIFDWNRVGIKQKLLSLADKYPHELLSADQALLNAFFAGNFFRLDQKYNIPWYAMKNPNVTEDAIFHFVGSPKPWDYLGKYLHSGYKKWNQYNTVSWQKNVLSTNKMHQLKRAWKIRRSYMKVIIKK